MSRAISSWATQSENHRRPSCQRGDSPRPIPLIRTRGSGVGSFDDMTRHSFRPLYRGPGVGGVGYCRTVDSGKDGVLIGADGVPRCWWCVGDPLLESDHDIEWGRPVAEDHRIFETLSLEGF